MVEQVIDPQEVKEAPEQWRCIGSEVSEQLDYEPAKFLRRRLVRRKYVSRQNPFEKPVIAQLPAVLQERGGAAPRTVGAHYREQVRRSLAPLSAGTDLPDKARGAFSAAHFGTMGGTGGGLVEADLPMHPCGSDGGRLRAGG